MDKREYKTIIIDGIEYAIPSFIDSRAGIITPLGRDDHGNLIFNYMGNEIKAIKLERTTTETKPYFKQEYKMSNEQKTDEIYTQCKIFLFINILSAIGFCFVAIPVVISQDKSIIELFQNFLIFYNPAIFLTAVATSYVGKKELAIFLSLEFVILYAINFYLILH